MHCNWLLNCLCHYQWIVICIVYLDIIASGGESIHNGNVQSGLSRATVTFMPGWPSPFFPRAFPLYFLGIEIVNNFCILVLWVWQSWVWSWLKLMGNLGQKFQFVLKFLWPQTLSGNVKKCFWKIIYIILELEKFQQSFVRSEITVWHILYLQPQIIFMMK